jgi:hypothetical protein
LSTASCWIRCDPGCTPELAGLLVAADHVEGKQGQQAQPRQLADPLSKAGVVVVVQPVYNPIQTVLMLSSAKYTRVGRGRRYDYIPLTAARAW